VCFRQWRCFHSIDFFCLVQIQDTFHCWPNCHNHCHKLCFVYVQSILMYVSITSISFCILAIQCVICAIIIHVLCCILICVHIRLLLNNYSNGLFLLLFSILHVQFCASLLLGHLWLHCIDEGHATTFKLTSLTNLKKK
jgi:hypothetical protein